MSSLRAQTDPIPCRMALHRDSGILMPALKEPQPVAEAEVEGRNPFESASDGVLSVLVTLQVQLISRV